MADLSITAANVKRSSTSISANTYIIAAGVTITQGQVVYQLAAGTIGLSDSNGSSPANSVLGISLTAGAEGQPCLVCPLDALFIFGGTSSSGNILYLSNTPGGITATYGDIASGSTVISLGGVLTGGTTMNLNPQVWGVK